MAIIVDLSPDDDLFEPLLVNANATITVVSTRTWEVDPTTGNLTEGSSIEVAIRAVLSPASRPDSQLLPGIDQKNQLLKGFLVEPKTMPEGVTNLTKGAIAFDNGFFNGECRLHIPVQNPYVKGKLGIKLFVELFNNDQ